MYFLLLEGTDDFIESLSVLASLMFSQIETVYLCQELYSGGIALSLGFSVQGERMWRCIITGDINLITCLRWPLLGFSIVKLLLVNYLWGDTLTLQIFCFSPTIAH